MSRDYAKRSSQNQKVANRKLLVKRKPLPSRQGSRSQAISAQAKRRPIKSSRRKQFHFPWRRMLALIILAVIVIFVIASLRHNADKINQYMHPKAPVIIAQPIELKSNKPTVIPPPKIVFENKNIDKADKNSYVLQLGVYTTGEDLIVLQNKLSKIKIRFHTIRIPRINNVYYRIEVGPFADETMAEKSQQVLRAHKIFSVLTKS